MGQDWLDNAIAQSGKAQPSTDWLGSAIAASKPPEKKRTAGDILKEATVGTIPYWKDLGRAAMQTTLGNAYGLAETVSSKIGMKKTAENLGKERQRLTQTIGDYETPVGLVGHLAGNVAGSVATGGALGAAQTAQAVADPQYSTAKFASDLTKRLASKDNKAARKAADALDKIAESDVGRPVFEAVLNLLPAAALERYAAVRSARQAAKPVPKSEIMPGEPGPVQGQVRALLGPGTDPSPLGPAIPMPGNVDRSPVGQTTASVHPVEQGTPPAATFGTPNTQAVRDFQQTLDEASVRRLKPVHPSLRDALKNSQGHVFANPFLNPDLLKAAGRATAEAGPVPLSLAGGAIGASADKEDRRRGFMIGAAIGGTAGVLLKTGITYADARRVRDMDLSVLNPQDAGTVQQFAGSVDMTGELEKAMQKEKAGGWLTRIQRVADNASDAVRPVNRFSEKAVEAGLPESRSPSTALNRALDTRNKIRQITYEGVPDVNGNIIAPGFAEVHKDLNGPGETTKAWTAYMLKRLVGRGVDAYGDPATFAQHEQALKALEADPKIASFVDKMKAHVDGVTKYIVDSGLWTPAEAAGIINSDVVYTPMRDLEKAVHGSAPSGIGKGSGLNPGKGVKSFRGVDGRTIKNPVTSYVEWMARMVDRADQANLNRTIFDAADQMGVAGEAVLTRNTQAVSRHGIPSGVEAAQGALAAAGYTPEQAAGLSELFTPTLSKHNSVITAVDGQGRRVVGVLQAQDLKDALMALRANGASDLRPIAALMGIGSRVFTLTHTGLNASFFAGKNLLMDIPTAIAQNKGTRPGDWAMGMGAGMKESIYEHLKEVAPKLAEIVGPSQLGEDARKFGLSNNSMFSSPITGGRVQRTVAPTTPGMAAVGVAQTALAEPLRAAEAIAGGLQRGPALAVFRATRRDLLKAGWTAVDAGSKAASVAGRAVVDYRRPLGNAQLRAVASVTPYLKAALLSSSRAASFARREPARAAVTAGLISTLAAIEWTQFKDNKALTDRPGNERSQGFEFSMPDGTVMQLTLNPEWGAIRTATLAALDQMRNDDPNTAELIHASIERALPPIANDLFNTGGDPRSFIPAGGPREIVEAYTNSKVYDQKPIESDYMQERLPPWERRFPSTPVVADAGAAALRKMGAENASPARVGHVIQGMLGGFTPAMNTVTDPTLGRPALRAMGEPLPPQAPESLGENPLSPLYAIARREVPYRTESQNAFDSFSKKFDATATQMQTATKRLRENPRDPQARSSLETLMNRSGSVLTDESAAIVQDVKQSVKESFDEETAIRSAFNAKQLPLDEARSEIDRIRKERQLIYRMAVGDLRKLGAVK